MNNKFNKNHISIAILTVVSVCFIIIFNKFSENLFNLFSDILNTILSILVMLKPFYIGVFIAIMINPIMKYIETVVLKPVREKLSKKALRGISVTTAYIIVLTTLYIIFIAIIPDTVISTTKLIASIPEQINNMKYFATVYFESESFANLTETAKELNSTLGDFNISILEGSENFAFVTEKLIVFSEKFPTMLESFVSSLLNIAKSFAQIVFSFVLAFYILIDKEDLLLKIKKITLSILGESKTIVLMEIVYSANDVFEKYFIGKIIDSLIIGSLFYFIANLLNLQYVGLSASIMAITNMIPYFGPFMGGVPIVLIALTQGFIDGVTALIIVIALQQFDGLVLGPKIISQSTGLRPITIIFAIMVGGKIAGPIGMFLAVPFIAVIIRAIIKIYEIRKEHKYGKFER